MKRRLMFLLLFTGIIISCSTSKHPEIYGTWRLRETLSDPGDGSGKYRPVGNQNTLLKIYRNGNISGTALSGTKSIKMLDSARLEVKSKTNNQHIIYHYTLSADFLTLIPPCIESCGLRFERIKK